MSPAAQDVSPRPTREAPAAIPPWRPPSIALITDGAADSPQAQEWRGRITAAFNGLGVEVLALRVPAGHFESLRFRLGGGARLSRRLRAQGVQAAVGLGPAPGPMVEALKRAGFPCTLIGGPLGEGQESGRVWPRRGRGQAIDALASLGLLRRVTAVIPNYNYARFLEARMREVDGQSYPIRELIVLDDASRDDSLAVIAATAEHLAAPVRLIANAENSGSVFAQWARGAAMAQGELIWIAEADDRASPSFLATLAPAFADEGVVMAQTQSREIGPGSEVRHPDYGFYLDEVGAERWRVAFTAEGRRHAAETLAVMNTIPNVSAVLFRTAVLRDALETARPELEHLRLAGDWLVYLEVLARGRFRFEPEPLNDHRVHGGSVTHGGITPKRRVLEVGTLQKIARDRFDPAAADQRHALAYLQKLYSYFCPGLDGFERVQDHPDFAALCRLPEEEAERAQSRRRPCKAARLGPRFSPADPMPHQPPR